MITDLFETKIRVVEVCRLTASIEQGEPNRSDAHVVYPPRGCIDAGVRAGLPGCAIYDRHDSTLQVRNLIEPTRLSK